MITWNVSKGGAPVGAVSLDGEQATVETQDRFLQRAVEQLSARGARLLGGPENPSEGELVDRWRTYPVSEQMPGVLVEVLGMLGYRLELADGKDQALAEP